ncbi:chemotaxis protein CheC [Planktothrix mougeotii]|uniref:Chemotaxis protein CheC n=1 Tax=Planktothrix mougeotii LEGE 06226 TaxID=1828728 RepID=A0ABR9UHU6_9CYAN|nr:chemotaxis protein CheC [Planktothrix mougeotii]MBE9145411.1 chemotaxis protein CheC [Planktothrix mougeotii LEGE 06226]
MLLTEKQKMALSQFMKIVLSRRTATALSQLIGSDVTMKVAEVSLSPLSKLMTELPNQFNEDIVSVHQMFKGTMSGDALLLLNYSFAVKLTNLLRPDQEDYNLYLNVSSCEVLMEAGNILLNSYINMLGTLMGSQFTFSIPTFQIEPLPDLIKSLMMGKNEVRYVLMVDTTFQFYHNSVQGSLVFVSGVIPLSCLIKGIEASIDLAIPNP